MNVQEQDERMVSRILDALFPGEYSMDTRMKVHDYLWGVLEHCDSKLWLRACRKGTPRERYDQGFKAGMEKAVYYLDGISLQQLAEEAAMPSTYDRLMALYSDPGKALDELYKTIDVAEGFQGEMGIYIEYGNGETVRIFQYDVSDEGEADGAIWLMQYVYSMVQGKEIPVWKKI